MPHRFSRFTTNPCRRVLTFLAFSLLCAQHVVAEDTTQETQKPEQEVIILERMMVIGDPDRVDDIPGSAHYINQAKLDKQSYNDILRILREVPGVNLQEEDGYGLRPNIGMRGTGLARSSKISVMEDGVLMAPAPYAAPAAYYFPTAGRMQGIEVRKGSSQIRHGPYTTGGALNMLSTSIPGSFSGRARILFGQNGSRNIQTYVGNAHRNFGWLVETYLAGVDGFKDLDGGGNTGFDKKDFLAKFRANTDRDADVYHELTLKLGRTDEVSNETYLGLTEADFRTTAYRRYAGSQVDEMNTNHEQAHVRYFFQPSGSFDLTTVFYRNNFHRNWYKLDRVRATTEGSRVSISSLLKDPSKYSAEHAIVTGTASPNDNALEVKANNREYYAQGVQTVLGLRTERRHVKHDVEVGLRYHQDQIDRFQWVDTYKMDDSIMKLSQAGVQGTESNRVETATAFASFVQYRLDTGRLSATPGLRYENIKITRDDYGKQDPSRSGSALTSRENSVDVWIPGIGIDYKFSPVASGFAGIHRGFAPPGSREGTDSENSVNYEFGLRYVKQTFNAQAVFYFNDYSNLLGSDLAAAGGEGTGDQFNGGKAISRGLEFGAAHDLGRAAGSRFSLPIRLVYTYTHTEFRNDFESDFSAWGAVQSGDELPYIPNHQLFLNLGISNGIWGFDLNGKYTSRMRTEAGSGPIIDEQSTDAHFVVDASVEWAVSRNVRLFAAVRNLTDKVYIVARRPAGLRPGPPRTFITGIKTHF